MNLRILFVCLDVLQLSCTHAVPEPLEQRLIRNQVQFFNEPDSNNFSIRMIIRLVDQEIVTSFPTVVKENKELKNRLTNLTNGLEVWLPLILLVISFVLLTYFR